MISDQERAGRDYLREGRWLAFFSPVQVVLKRDWAARGAGDWELFA